MKFHPLSWRASHPYVLVDRFEDVTPPERVQLNNKCDRNVTLYGYLRGCNLKKETKVHMSNFYVCIYFSKHKLVKKLYQGGNKKPFHDRDTSNLPQAPAI